MNTPEPNSTTSNNSGHKLGTIMIHLSWVALIILLAILMQRWLDQRYNPNTSPLVTTVNGQQQLTLQRNPYGHYIANGYINGYEAAFLLDTGATDVVIPAKLAKTFNLEQGYPTQVKTANGIITVYSTQLEQVALGPIRLHNVRGSINPKMEDDEILLGMSFLKQLSLTQYQDKLIISNPQPNQ